MSPVLLICVCYTAATAAGGDGNGDIGDAGYVVIVTQRVITSRMSQ